jgi:RHS repeat-associated protein
VVERRSYDAFGQRRNPVWGQPPPGSFTSKTTKGFTGHEGDDELGLVNMKGRILDPKLGRFLTTDPIVSNLHDGQSFNAYSYTRNNPLAFVDPSGFQGVPASPVLSMPEGQPEDVVTPGAGFRVAQYLNHEGPSPSTPGKSTSDAAESGAAAPATDVDTTGSSKEKDPEPEDPTPPEGWTQIPYVQVEGGFVAGVSLGLVPFGGVGQQVLDAAEVLPHGTPEARRGLAVGQIVGGLITLVGGLTGEVAGGLATTTGIGAAVGVSTIAVSTTLVVGGAANVAAGIRGLTQSMMSSVSGSSGPQATTPAVEGGPKATTPYKRPSGATTPQQRASVQGKPCVDCGAVTPKQVADHKTPLVKEHYETGSIDKTRMRSTEAVQPQCPTCSNRQGAGMSRYSREMKENLGP